MTKFSTVVFVVDDDESVRKALKRLIKSAGFQVETFASAEDFLNYVHRDALGCLIIDVRMPGLSGLDLQSELAASGSKMPVIFITAHDDDQARLRAVKGGAVAFLQKPFEEQALLHAICVAIDRISSEEQEKEPL
jgi:FixJ family two-component response regulator